MHSNLQPQKNENHELETIASRQNPKQQNNYIEDGSQLKTNEKSETNAISSLELASERSKKRYKEATYTAIIKEPFFSKNLLASLFIHLGSST